MGRGTNNFTAVLGERRGKTIPQEKIDAAADALQGLMTGSYHYYPEEEARAILEAGNLQRACAAMQEITGLQEDYTDFVKIAINAAQNV